MNFIDVRDTSQENIAHEIEEISKRRGVQMDFVTFWKFRSRHVAGVDPFAN
jgi:hypothetical protein